MAMYYVDESQLLSIADAIRAKNGTTASLAFPSAFAATISNLYDVQSVANRSLIAGSMTFSSNNIGSYAYGGTSLTFVNLPNATVVGSVAFRSCVNLTEVSAPKLTSIHVEAFRYNANLNAFYAPSLAWVSNYAFQGCSSLYSIAFPKVTAIGQYAFASCGIANVADEHLGVCTIGSYAFASCLSLINFYRSTKALSIVRPGTFDNCRSLSTVRLNKVTAINSYAFRSCYKLKSLYLHSLTAVPTLSANAFGSCPIGGYSTSLGAYGSVYVPSSLYASFLTAKNWSAISARIVSANI